MVEKPKVQTPTNQVTDVLNIAGELIPEIDSVLNELLERGKKERVMILPGTEISSDHSRKPYARTKVEITFDNEEKLRRCVQMLRWSDDRLRARPDQLMLWTWTFSFREGMSIYFGVTWYDREFFEKRKEAFMEPQHAGYYALFGATPEDFKMQHEVFEAKHQ